MKDFPKTQFNYLLIMRAKGSNTSTLRYTVKLGYNELGYNELPLITNKFFILVGSRLWFSWL